MRKLSKLITFSIALLFCVALGVKGYVLQVASGLWAPQANLGQARSGASITLLKDGRLVVTGGEGSAGTLASAEIIGLDGASSAVAPMGISRSRHISVVLSNGSVLVAGGTTSGGGATNAAEIYDPVADSWSTLAGGMIEARSNATSALLQDGRVLIVGGEKFGSASSTIEIFDPATLTFSFAGALASPRTEHAMALLTDGRVIIVGGSTGTAAVNSTDIYDPIAGNVSAGPVMSTPRSGHSATVMLDGRVLIAGGNNGSADLATAEIFDPVQNTIAPVASPLSTPRQGHLAFLLPNNNTILIAAGTSAGLPLASAEIFTPWLGTFAPTGSLSTVRSLSVGSAMKQDGLLLVAGGQDASGVAVANEDLYGFATVKTDQADYPPDTTVNITGSGWQPGETVTLTLVETPLLDTHGPFTVIADANGSISNSSFVTDEHDLNINFLVTAVGSASQAQNAFKDSKPNTVTVGAQNPDPIAPGASAQYTVTVGFNGNGSSCTSPLSIQNPAVLPTGATASFSPTSLTSTGGNATSTLTIATTNSTPPTSIPISFTVLAGNGAGCQAGTATGTGSLVIVESTTTTLSSSVNPSGFGQSTTLTATVAKTSGPTTPNAGTVTFKDGATSLGTGTLNGSGVATLAVSSLTAGSHNLTASYQGTAIFGASASNTVSQTVNPTGTTTTLVSGTNPSASGQSVTFTATVAAVAPGSGTATGTVTFKDGAATIGTGTLAGNTATLSISTLTVGSHSITATYNGDTNFSASTSSALSQTVNQASTTTTITAHTPSPSVVGQAVNITFTVTGGSGTPTGAVTVSDGAGDSCTATAAIGNCSITFPASGTKTLSAVYAGDANFTGSTSANVSHAVNTATTLTTITAHTPNPSVIGQAITVNYSVTVNSPGSGTIPGTDNVAVSDGTGDTCTGTVAAGTCQLTASTSGAKTLVATFAAGDANFATSTSAGVSHTVNQAPTILSANNTTFQAGTAGSFAVTATGFPTPTFSESGALPSGVTLSAVGVLAGTPAANTGGSYAITITASNGVSPNATQSFVLTVNQAPAITGANTTSFVANAPGTFTFTATGFPTTMTFTETGSLPNGVTLSSGGVLSGTATATGNFPITITASNGITPNATQSFTLTVGQAPAFTSVNSTAFTVLTAGSFTVSASGFPAPTFSTSSALPSGVTLTAVGLLSGTPASGTAGSYPITITANNGIGAGATQNFTLTVNKLTPTFSPALSSPAAIAFGTSTVNLPPASVMVTTGSIRAASPDTVTISINGASSAPINFNGSSGTFGPTTFNTQLIPVGTYPITYTYSGGANFESISDSSTTLTVNKANQTITVTTPAPASAGFNSSFSVAATANSGLVVTFSSSGVCSNVGATFTMNSGTGTCAVKFDQAGSSNYNAAAQVTESVTAQQATATVTLSNLTQTYTGGALVPTATTNPAGLSIVWTGAPDTNVGSYPVTAKVNDPNYQGSANGTFAITGAATTTSLSAPAVTYPANGIVTVTVSSAGGTPTGNATLVVDGGLPLVAALNGSGIATFTLANPSPGSHALSATYAAQGNFGASGPATGNLVVSQAPVITSSASTMFTAAIAGSFSVTTMGYPAAALSESGALPSGVTFTDNGNGAATLAGTTTAGGIYTFTITAANIVGNQSQTFTLTVSAGAFTKLQVLVPGETAAPGTATGKTGTPTIEYVNGPFNATVNAVDDNWNVVNSVTDTVKVTSNDGQAVLPADAALVAGTGTFSVKLETVANPAATTVTASDVTDAGKNSNSSPAIEVIVVYTASISPSTASNGTSTAYTLTVNNAGTPNTNDLKSVTVAIPTNGGVPSGISVAATSPANWMVDPNPPSSFLRFHECTPDDGCNGAGTNDVNPGGNITIQFTTTASESISGTAVNQVWTTTAFSDSAYATPLPLAGTEPTVAIGAGAVITSANSTTFTNGAASTFKVTTTGVPTPSLSETGALPSGVSFTDNADGTATLAGTTRAAGDFPITITAHNGYGAPGTQTFTLTVTKATTSTDVVSSLNPSFSGQAVTFTATVTVAADVPTGTVQFQDAGMNLGTAVTLANHSGVFTAQLQTSGLSVGTHSINAIYSGDNNFSTSTSSAMTQIVKSAVTNTSISAPAITYGADGLVTVTVAPQDASAGTPSGSVTLSVDGGTAVSQTLVNGSSTFTIANPGAGDHTLSATYAAQNNFLGSSATASLHVNQAVATLIFGPLTFTYDGTPKPVSVTTVPTNLAGVSILYGASPTPPTNAGSTAVSATLTNANYAATPISGTEVIEAAPVVITVSDPMPTYDGNPHAATISMVPIVAVVTTYNGSATLPSAAGTYAVSVMTADPNYAGSGTGTLTIKPAALTVTANDKSRAYGATNPNFDGTVTGVLNNDPITATYASTATSASPAGTYDITPTLSDAGSGTLANYAVTSNKGQLTITAIPLYVIANDKSRVYGAADPSFDAQYSGFVNTDNPSSLGGNIGCASNSSGTSLAGTYGIHCGGLSSINYSIHYVDGTLSVTNPLSAITEIKGASPNSETLTIGQTDTLTATGKFTDASMRALAVAGGTSYAKAALSTPVSGAAIAEAGGILYAIGGFDGANTVGTIQAYDPKNDNWTVLPNTVALGNPRTNAAVASAAGKIYVLGGKDANGQALASVEVLDTTGANPVVSAYSASLSMARSAAGASAFHNKLYVIGGSDNSSALSSVETFDLITGTTVLTDPGNALAQASAAVVTKNNTAKLYVAGVSGSSIVLVNFDGLNWSSPVSTTLDASQGVGAASLGELLYMMNGADVWSYDGSSLVHKNSLGNAHNATQPVSIGMLIYGASTGSGSASSKLDAFAPDEVKWTSADATKATVDQSGKITAVAITSPTVAITGTSLSDANISADFLLTIIKKTQTIQFDSLLGKTYGDADFSVSATSLDSTSTPTGLLVGLTAGSGESCTVGASTLSAGVSSANVHITGAGNCTITFAQPGDDTTWMAATSVSQTFTIAKAALTVTADNVNRFYGANNPSFTGNISGIKNGDNITATYASTATPASAAGTYPIVPTLVDPDSKLGNYMVTSTNGTLTIKAVSITVTAYAKTKVYGDTDPALTYKITSGSLFNGDTFSGSLTRAAGENVADYAITQGSLALSDNYTLTYVGANLTIVARPIAVTADEQTKVYGYNDPSLTYKITAGSLVTGDVFSGGLTRVAGENVGTYAIGQGTLVLNTNYNLTYVGANLGITARPIVVTADGQTKVYGYNDPILTYKITTGALVTGDTFSGGLTRGAGENVGSYAILEGTLSLSTNYNLTYIGANLLITARPVTVTANPQGKLFGQSDPPLTFQIIVGSLVSTDTFAGGLVRVAGEAPGTYPILRGSLALSSNYTLSYIGANLAIAQASTATSLSSSGSPSNWGQVVIFTATVGNSTLNSTGMPTGAVNFYNAASGATCQSLASANVLPLDTEPLVTIGSSQQASTSTPALPVGNNSILACYNGDNNFIGSSGSVPQTVLAAPIAKLSPASLSFGNQQGGTTSGPQTVSISNLTGTAPLLISSIKLAGTNPTYFTETDSCSSVAIGGSCVITVRFAPPASTTGVATAVLVVTDNDENTPGSTQSSLLTGAGTSSINSVGSLSTYGIFATANGCSSINMSGNAVVDSFNSASNNNGNVGTNGNVNLSGNPVVNGAVYSPITGTGSCSSKSMTGLSTNGKAQATGGLQALAGPLTYPAPPAPSPAPPTTAQNISGSCGSVAGCSSGGSKTVTLAPGQYGNLSITGGTTVNVSGGTYNVNSLTLSGNSTLVVNTASGPVVVNLAGKSITGGNTVLDLTGGVMSNASGRASNLQFYYAGSQPVKLTGNAASYATVYAPNAPVNLSGGSHFYGAITGSTINNSGGTAIHYDASLPNIPQGDYIWFNSAALNVQGLPASGSVKVYVTNASISFPSTTSQCSVPTISGRCTLPVPNAVITFSSTVSTASTTWDATSNRWSTLVPTNGYSSLQTRAFVDGLAYLAPASFPSGIQNVTWSAAFSTSTPGINFSWQWGAAVYNSFSSNNAMLNVNPSDSADPAGTPESYKNSLIFGAMGPGYVGLYTPAAGVVPTIAEASVSPSSLDFSNGGAINQTVGTTSSSLTAVLTNNMSGPLLISSVQITGTNPGDFTQVNNCPVSPSSLASGGTCTISVAFKPTGTNKRTAKIVVNDTANNSPQTVFLKGTGQ